MNQSNFQKMLSNACVGERVQIGTFSDNDPWAISSEGVVTTHITSEQEPAGVYLNNERIGNLTDDALTWSCTETMGDYWFQTPTKIFRQNTVIIEEPCTGWCVAPSGLVYTFCRGGAIKRNSDIIGHTKSGTQIEVLSDGAVLISANNEICHLGGKKMADINPDEQWDVAGNRIVIKIKKRFCAPDGALLLDASQIEFDSWDVISRGVVLAHNGVCTLHVLW